MKRKLIRQHGEIMKKRKNEITAFLGRDTEFEGNLSFKGMVRIDGRFKGEINTEGTLIVGETAVIDSDIHASNVIISGEIRGHVVAGEKIEILSPGKVFGDIEAPSVTINTGVIFEGNCQTQQRDEVANDKVTFLQKPSETKNEG
jgi:cytoskeletal protein CcmA (bactofilin family)